ncbi:hypothetical protein CCACVL1_01741 [Corchorus capsularis]|uniref:Uncharacterized protein n=1 Tax=Corchorus capsularis TaxID=210143 RepID=A0A1R3KG28_COCAP|nr:hypothetical protein CCACVL1_01741 [Corchorus capsularis]
MIMIRESTARELRPSDHGLEYQSLPPTGLKSPEMRSFFGASSSKSSTPSTVALPKAMNSNETETPWWSGRHGRGSDHVKQVLLLGSLVCGVTGVALLVASAFIYIIRRRSSQYSSAPNDTNTSGGLVVITK